MKTQSIITLALATATLMLCTSFAKAQTEVLNTFPSVNSNAGMMFDITGKREDGIFLRKVETLTDTGHENSDFRVYTRAGTYVGNENSSAGWTLVSELTIVDPLVRTYYDLEVPEVILDQNETLGVYICVINYNHQGNPVHVSGVGLSSIDPPFVLPTYENEIARIDGGTRKLAAALSGGDPFGSQSDPGFQWGGRITVAPVPEPGTFVALGIGITCLALLRRRR